LKTGQSTINCIDQHYALLIFIDSGSPSSWLRWSAGALFKCRRTHSLNRSSKRVNDE
jgi:hypothetical protein